MKFPKILVATICTLIIMGIGIYLNIRVLNEVGFLGMDKGGRHILLETLCEIQKDEIKINLDSYNPTFICPNTNRIIYTLYVKFIMYMV